MTQGDPEVMKVQWLEDSLLVHAVTVAGETARVDANLWMLGAAGSAGGVGIAMVAGSVLAAAVFGALWLGCAIALLRRGWQVSRTATAPPRRLLVELRPERVAWTLLAGDKWSMRHDHEHPVAEVVEAVQAETPLGVVVRMELVGGRTVEIPLYGLPAGDASWLADRIGELLPTPE